MTHRDDLDRLLMAWVDDPYSPPAPHYLSQVLERTRRTRQRTGLDLPRKVVPDD